jgi:hypothetical protein
MIENKLSCHVFDGEGMFSGEVLKEIKDRERLRNKTISEKDL